MRSGRKKRGEEGEGEKNNLVMESKKKYEILLRLGVAVQ